MTKKKRVEKLEEGIERVFFQFTILVAIVVLIAIFLGAKFMK